MKDSDVIEYLKQRHEHFCLRAKSFMDCLGKDFKSPSFNLYSKNHKIGAWARFVDCCCHYNLAYALTAKEDYDSTIAHEVAHHVVHQLYPRAKDHSDMFKWVTKEIYGKESKIKHSHRKTEDSIRTGKLLVMLYELKHPIRKAACIAQ